MQQRRPAEEHVVNIGEQEPVYSPQFRDPESLLLYETRGKKWRSSEKWVHAIPWVVLFCIFMLWWFSVTGKIANLYRVLVYLGLFAWVLWWGFLFLDDWLFWFHLGYVLWMLIGLFCESKLVFWKMGTICSTVCLRKFVSWCAMFTFVGFICLTFFNGVLCFLMYDCFDFLFFLFYESKLVFRKMGTIC